MNKLAHECDVLIVGAGPAGLAAAESAAQSGRRVSVVDDNPAPGGQIWRGAGGRPAPPAADWVRRLEIAGAELIAGARVFDHPRAGRLLAETAGGVRVLDYRCLILATGARERFLPFPGWTLPNVCGAGGLQALVKAGLPVVGKRVVVAGTGPLLLAVGAYLRDCGADVRLIAEQAPWARLWRFGLGLARTPGKIFEALGLELKLLGIPFQAGCWPVAALGYDKLSSIVLRHGDRTWNVPCDYLACGFHLVPNLELAGLLGCALEGGEARVDEWQQTSMPGVYAAGEATGIGGLELSLVEGRIAGYAAAERPGEARRQFAARSRLRRFARALNEAFALREELKAMPQAETIVCRCEDVTLERLRVHTSWRGAKLQTRCGMGPCQGRICGAATAFLFGWGAESARPPVFPARVESLAHPAHHEG